MYQAGWALGISSAMTYSKRLLMLRHHLNTWKKLRCWFWKVLHLQQLHILQWPQNFHFWTGSFQWMSVKWKSCFAKSAWSNRIAERAVWIGGTGNSLCAKFIAPSASLVGGLHELVNSFHNLTLLQNWSVHCQGKLSTNALTAKRLHFFQECHFSRRNWNWASPCVVVEKWNKIAM